MIITKTPLRISFLGGGSDFPAHYNTHGGACLSATIDKYIYVILEPRLDNKIILSYSQREEVDSIADIKHDLIRSALSHTKFTPDHFGLEIHTIADISGHGSGLGSSSSLLVGLLFALEVLRQHTSGDYGGIHPAGIAETANYLEIDILNRPQGIQDAYPPAYGGLNLYRFSQRGVSVSCIDTDLDALSDYLMMFSTGKSRQSKEVLKEQHARTTENTSVIKALGRMATEGKRLIENGQYKDFGVLMDRGWRLKKQMSSAISNPLIDLMYTTAKQAGAIGGKICGAGGGGYLLLVVEPERQEAIREAMRDYTEMGINLTQGGSYVVCDDN